MDRALWRRFVLLLAASLAVIALTPLHARAGAFAEISLGRSQIPHFFEHARFAFPDLATGGPGCCQQTDDTESTAGSVRLAVGRRYANGFALEASLEAFGARDSSFDVSGPFGTALGVANVQSGRCVESGRFRFSGVTLAASYEIWRSSSVAIAPRAGISGVLMDYSTASHCDFLRTDGSRDAIDVVQDRQRFDFVPMLGIGARWRIRPGLELALNAELREGVLVSDNAEARSYQQGRPRLFTVWIGLPINF